MASDVTLYALAGAGGCDPRRLGYLIRSFTTMVKASAMIILKQKVTRKGITSLASVSIGKPGKALSGFPSRPLESLLSHTPRNQG